MTAAQSAEIARCRAAAEGARIGQERAIKKAEIARDRAVRASEIARNPAPHSSENAKQMDMHLKQQDRQIKIAEKAQAESAARAAARPHAAKSEAAAERERAAAKKEAVLAEADGQRALNGAENMLGDRPIRRKEDIARIETLPKALAEMVKPAERIETIKIHTVTGRGGGQTGGGQTGGGQTGGGQTGGDQTGGGDKAPVNQALESILGMARHPFDQVASGAVEVTIGRRFALERVAEAHRALAARAMTGSTILTL